MKYVEEWFRLVEPFLFDCFSTLVHPYNILLTGTMS